MLECGPAGPCNTLQNHKYPCQPTNMANFGKIFANFRSLDKENGDVVGVLLNECIKPSLLYRMVANLIF